MPVLAQNTAHQEYCTNLTVRYTMFHMSALVADNEDMYKQQLYSILLKNKLDKDSNELLKNLIDLAWLNASHKKDTLDSAMMFYHFCMNEKSV
jgi:hypothetical protein